MPPRAIRPADLPRRAAFRESPFREVLALDPSPGTIAGLLRGQQPAPGAFGLFFDCGDPCRFDPAALTDDGVAVLRISGPIETEDSWLWSSYEGIARAVREARDHEAVRAIALRVLSPGGMARGMFEAHAAIREVAAQKPVYAWCPQACSAACELASACSEVWVPEDGEVGSVGVILCMVDESAALREAGIAVRYIVSGARKADGQPGAPVTPEIIREEQAKVDHLASLFFRDVAAGRGLRPAYVQALEAATFLGGDAVEIGLADGVAPWTEFLDFVRGSIGATVGTPRSAQTVPAAQPPAS